MCLFLVGNTFARKEEAWRDVSSHPEDEKGSRKIEIDSVGLEILNKILDWNCYWNKNWDPCFLYIEILFEIILTDQLFRHWVVSVSATFALLKKGVNLAVFTLCFWHLHVMWERLYMVDLFSI